MNRDALHDHLERLHAESYGWALACCRHDTTMAEDVLQTTYVKVLDGRATFGGTASFRTWLFAIIRNTAVDAQRKRRVRAVFQLRKTQDPPGQVRPDAALEAAEATERFRRLLARLPTRQSEVLHLVFYHDLTVREAAEVMGVSAGSASTHYARGKARLHAWLTNDEHESIYPG